MRLRPRAIVASSIERGLSASGYDGAELQSAASITLDWARVRARALRHRRGLVGGLAVVVTGPGRVELRTVEHLLAGPDAITIEVLVSAISSGTERAQWLRLPNAQPMFPYTPGYSGVGRVLAHGEGVTELPIGTLVAVARLPHSSVSTVPAAWATRIPEGVQLADAALVYLAIIAGYGVRRSVLTHGQSLCIVGAGPIGALAQRLAMLLEPASVTIVARSHRHEAAALRAGATDFRAGEPLDDVAADVVIEVTGDPSALASAVSAAAPGATVVLLGSPRGPTDSAFLVEVREKGLRLVGAHISALAVEAKLQVGDPFQSLASTYLEALAERRIAADDLAGVAADPREIGLAYRRLAAGGEPVHLDWRLLPAAQRLRRTPLLSPPALPPVVPRLAPDAERASRSSGKRLRFAAIGCGDIGLANARAIAAAVSADLVLCHDKDVTLADNAVREAGGSVARTLLEALDPAVVDAVFLSVPHDLHTPLIEQASAAGLQVVVEKPLANNLEAARRGVAAADKHHVALSVCFPYRYEPAIEAARRLVRAGALGTLRGATIAFHADKPDAYWAGGFSGRARSDWRRSLGRAGGGVLIMNVTHYLDFLQHVAGLVPSRLVATSSGSLGAEIEEAIAITVDFEGGAIGSLLASASTRGSPATRFEIWGDHGTLRLEPAPSIYTERAINGLVPGRWYALPEAAMVDPRTRFVERFSTAVLEGRPPDVSAADGLAVQTLVEAAYRSAASQEWVSMTEEAR